MTTLPSRSTPLCFVPELAHRSRRSTCATASGRWSRHCGSKRSGRSSSSSTFCRRRSWRAWIVVRPSLPISYRMWQFCSPISSILPGFRPSCRPGIWFVFWADCFRSLTGWRSTLGSRKSRQSETLICWPAAYPSHERTMRTRSPTWP